MKYHNPVKCPTTFAESICGCKNWGFLYYVGLNWSAYYIYIGYYTGSRYIYFIYITRQNTSKYLKISSSTKQLTVINYVLYDK